MAEGARRPALVGLSLANRVTAGASVRLAEVAFPAQLSVRLRPGGAAANRAAGVLGVPLPEAPNTAALAADTRVLWLGPDEWLVLAPDGDASRLQAELSSALGSEPGSVIDVSAQRAVLSLSGPNGREVLAKGCPIDLHPSVFGPGRCAQTLLAKARVVVLPVGPDEFWILVGASFSGYLVEWLLDAMSEYDAKAS
ncbi:MAG: sarcosine oxidase subunit gamma [Candidatus Dormibacteraeota bacterium]|nr:sarcosine oxidase subunit gamma [Candidatus Dormibacteraeota bacterium]